MHKHGKLGRQEDRQKDRETEGQINRQTEMCKKNSYLTTCTYMEGGREGGRGRQTGTETEGESDRETETDSTLVLNCYSPLCIYRRYNRYT